MVSVHLLSCQSLNLTPALPRRLTIRPLQHFEEKCAHQLDRVSQFAVYAARQALRDAALIISEDIALEAATIVGNAAGGQTTVDEGYERLYRHNAARLHPSTIPRWMADAAGCQVSIDLGLKGPAWTVASACASGTHAIGQAFHLLRHGHASVALAGGAEATLTGRNDQVLGGAAGAERRELPCRPFSRTRSGMVLGEGAADARAGKPGTTPYGAVPASMLSCSASAQVLMHLTLLPPTRQAACAR